MNRLAQKAFFFVSALTISRSYAVDLPVRPTDAKGASEIIEELLRKESGGINRRLIAERDQVFRCEVKKGNVPAHSRSWTGISTSCGQNEVTFYVSSDYLAIGSDDDLLHINVGADTAQALANELGFVLPTTKMVRIIQSVSNSNLSDGAAILIPGKGLRESNTPCAGDRGMVSTRCLQYYEENIFGNEREPGHLYFGYKKDIVQVRDQGRHNKVAIFGWQIGSQFPIQPYSTVHEASYSDYSHGLRMVKKVILINGEEVPIERAIHDRRAACLFDEGQAPEMQAVYGVEETFAESCHED
jgi:hypothetical protein